MITFNHSGKIGDILYSLYFCKELSEFFELDKFNFNIQINVPEPSSYANSEETAIRLSKETVEFIEPLLKSQEFINNLTISDEIPNTKPLINLDIMRKLPINTSAGNIINYYYNIFNEHLPRIHDKKILNVKTNDKFKDKIVLIHTKRYNNVNVDLKLLEEFKDHLVFIGTNTEYETFKNEYFDLEYYKCKDMLEMAEILNGAKALVGNQSGIFALAECLKIKRILIPAEFIEMNGAINLGPANVLMNGGWFDYAAMNDKLINLIRGILK